MWISLIGVVVIIILVGFLVSRVVKQMKALKNVKESDKVKFFTDLSIGGLKILMNNILLPFVLLI